MMRAAADRNYLAQLQAARQAQLQRQADDPISSMLRNAFAPRDSATISQVARDRIATEDADKTPAKDPFDPNDDPELSDSQEQAVQELKKRDREVRQHEQAHKAAAGDLATSGPNYTYQTGPDGKRYAIGGEVQIRLQTGRTPEETIRKMERATRAANAPQSPSGPDQAVAAQATRMLANARKQMIERNHPTEFGATSVGKRLNVVA